jgi:urea carboxylase
VLVQEASEIKPKEVVCILEAMKLEINVNVPDELKAAKVEKLLVQPGETVKSGAHIALLRL